SAVGAAFDDIAGHVAAVAGPRDHRDDAAGRYREVVVALVEPAHVHLNVEAVHGHAPHLAARVAHVEGHHPHVRAFPAHVRAARLSGGVEPPDHVAIGV